MKYTFPDEKIGWTALTSLKDRAAASWRSAMFYLLSTCVDVYVVVNFLSQVIFIFLLF